MLHLKLKIINKFINYSAQLYRLMSKIDFISHKCSQQKKECTLTNTLFFVIPLRLELRTHALKGRCSTNWATESNYLLYVDKKPLFLVLFYRVCGCKYRGLFDTCKGNGRFFFTFFVAASKFVDFKQLTSN